jgi:hypothetical protein
MLLRYKCMDIFVVLAPYALSVDPVLLHERWYCSEVKEYNVQFHS